MDRRGHTTGLPRTGVAVDSPAILKEEPPRSNVRLRPAPSSERAEEPPRSNVRLRVRFAAKPVSAVVEVPGPGGGGRSGPWVELAEARRARARLAHRPLESFAREEAAAEELQALVRGGLVRRRAEARRRRARRRPRGAITASASEGGSAGSSVAAAAHGAGGGGGGDVETFEQLLQVLFVATVLQPESALPDREQRAEAPPGLWEGWHAATEVRTAAAAAEAAAAPLFFWSHRPERVGATACLSNWSAADFALGGVAFSSSEQALMHAKALLFGDVARAAAILAVAPPGAGGGVADGSHGSAVQRLGRGVTPFDPVVWGSASVPVAAAVLEAKFTQNEALGDFLLSTGDRLLVEASPHDEVWGIGLDAAAAAALAPDELARRCSEGNRLGRVLMAVRARLRSQRRGVARRAAALVEGAGGAEMREGGCCTSVRGGVEPCSAVAGDPISDRPQREAALALERRAQRVESGRWAAGPPPSCGGEGRAVLALGPALRRSELVGAEVSDADLEAAVHASVSDDDALRGALLATGLAELCSADGGAFARVLERVRERLRREAVEACDEAELRRRNACKEANLLPGAPRGLPACFGIDHELLVADARALLERGEFDDAAHVAELAEFGVTGGFRAFGRPLERDVYGDGSSDNPLRVNAAMDLSMLKTLYITLREELDKGWLTRYADRAAVPYRFIRVQPMFFVPKGDSAGGQAVKVQVDPADGVEREMLRWRLCEDAKRSGLNASSSMAYDLKRGSAGQLDDVRDAGDLIMGFRRRGLGVEMSLTDLSGAYRQWPLSDLDRPSFSLYGLDVTRPFPAASELHVDAKGIVHLRADQCCFYVSDVLRFGWHRSVSHFWRSARLLKALHLSEETPVETFVPRSVHDLATFLDDNLSVAVVGWGERAKRRLHEVFARYGVAISLEKDERDGKVEFEKQFLGIILDAVRDEMRISAARLDKVLAKLEDAKDRSFMLRSEFASLVGLLSFCASCAPASRVFCRRMFASLKRSHGRFLRLDRGLKADISFWLRFAPTQNGTSLMLEEEWVDAEELRFWTDASLDGYGAAFQLPSGEWEYFGGEWARFGVDTSEMHISQLEMLAAAMAFDTWGEHLARKRVVTRCDNESSVFTINALSGGGGRTTDAGMLVVAREIFFICAKHSFMTRSKHIGTKLNVLADAASRADWRRFFAYAKSEFGVAREAMREVEPTLDTAGMLAKIRKATLTERRLDEEAAVARSRGRTPPGGR